ncbi:major pollen allergen Ole e 10-like [Prunus avium]|uniref:Major pollen allergen Ole e 10-like n=1 Tax=Prunus avium TaxID=42229 RepID=A0A6P5S608_PRUAV|nr:major pollen allergen Ole e 10-like [Prunus avium]XP_021812420.1 major pollen allergen Ole e 10-like [Prunus avium]
MRKNIWVLVLQCLLLLGCYLVSTMELAMEEKADEAIPVTTMSPPEGNTTFLDGTTWCVALPGVSQVDLQNALDWACGLGMANCKAIQEGGACYEPDTLLSHASFAFNDYYQQNGNSDIACNFGGTAAVTKYNPSHGKCVFDAAGVASAAPPLYKLNPSSVWWQLACLLLPLYLGS